ncbi:MULTISPECIES: excalibur calcium-binding domain-containing protein [Novosphingobium]|uniref:excalibur calcium-binding domain-containing protein n=1 Tax=Novosphingobium sp. TaxID=1874826 RepID=UPI0012C06745|nr:excalibur calcium-binding domain-containing protein [Novosphingobium sp.]MPS67989.1 excalibur calcium-binding domain-containing protein [Novosphingobium sp.]
MKRASRSFYRSSISFGHDPQMVRSPAPYSIRALRRRRSRSVWQTVGGYFLVAICIGGTAGLALNAFDRWRTESAARQALLDTLPEGYVFRTCGEVEARGLAPLYRGERGFGHHLDSDHDGTGCEPYP